MAKPVKVESYTLRANFLGEDTIPYFGLFWEEQIFARGNQTLASKVTHGLSILWWGPARANHEGTRDEGATPLVR